MALDSLALAILIGLLADPSNPQSAPLDGLPYDRMTITVTIELEETTTVVTSPYSPGKGIHRSPVTPAAAVPSNLLVLRPGDRTVAVATSWGVSSAFIGDIGYLSVYESADIAGWSLRTTISQPINTRKEEELRWSLVRGVF